MVDEAVSFDRTRRHTRTHAPTHRRKEIASLRSTLSLPVLFSTLLSEAAVWQALAVRLYVLLTWAERVLIGGAFSCTVFARCASTVTTVSFSGGPVDVGNASLRVY